MNIQVVDEPHDNTNQTKNTIVFELFSLKPKLVEKWKQAIEIANRLPHVSAEIDWNFHEFGRLVIPFCLVGIQQLGSRGEGILVIQTKNSQFELDQWFLEF